MLKLFTVLIYWPLALLLCFANDDLRMCIEADIERWLEGRKASWKSYSLWMRVLLVAARHPEFLNLYRYRLKTQGSLLLRIMERLLRPFYYGERTLFIKTSKIGKGLRIQHGFATIISADAIGEHCWINQQVTIGYVNETDCPIIGNNVRISSGAQVLGRINIGDNVVIGANAVVVKDVPPNCTVAGVPARIIRRNGIRVEEKL